jgi:hypothetical protein
MHHPELILALLAIGFAVVGLILLFLRRMRDPLPPSRHNDRPDWYQGTALVVAVIGLFSFMDSRDARIARDEQATANLIARGYLPPDVASITVNLNQCPLRSDGMTDTVLMVIASAADKKPVLQGCSRIANRPGVRS